MLQLVSVIQELMDRLDLERVPQVLRLVQGVEVHPLRQIPDERGKVMHMLRCDDPWFRACGEIYFSVVLPGGIKAWHLRRVMTIHYAVPSGRIKLVLYDGRGVRDAAWMIRRLGVRPRRESCAGPYRNPREETAHGA